MDYKFQTWTKRKDIFGFEREINYGKSPKDPDDTPIQPFNLEELTNTLSEHSIGIKRPNLHFVDEIVWGEGSGSLKLKIRPDMQVEILREALDLSGEKVYISKRLFAIDAKKYAGKEMSVVQDLLEELDNVDKSPLESPKKELKNFEALVIHVASKIRITANEDFIFEGVRKTGNDDYIIRFSIRGSGQGGLRPTQTKIFENHTKMNYSKELGIIHVVNYNILDATRDDFRIGNVALDAFFFPSQSKDEITEVIASSLHNY